MQVAGRGQYHLREPFPGHGSSGKGYFSGAYTGWLAIRTEFEVGEKKNKNLVWRAEATLHEQKTLAEARYSGGGGDYHKNVKCQGLGWQPRNTPRGTARAASLPLCLSVFGKPASHQQGQRTASPGRAQVEPQKIVAQRAGRVPAAWFTATLRRGLAPRKPMGTWRTQPQPGSFQAFAAMGTVI